MMINYSHSDAKLLILMNFILNNRLVFKLAYILCMSLSQYLFVAPYIDFFIAFLLPTKQDNNWILRYSLSSVFLPLEAQPAIGPAFSVEHGQLEIEA